MNVWRLSLSFRKNSWNNPNRSAAFLSTFQPYFAIAWRARNPGYIFSRFDLCACHRVHPVHSFEIQDGGVNARWKFAFSLQKMRWVNEHILASISAGELKVSWYLFIALSCRTDLNFTAFIEANTWPKDLYRPLNLKTPKIWRLMQKNLEISVKIWRLIDRQTKPSKHRF